MSQSIRRALCLGLFATTVALAGCQTQGGNRQLSIAPTQKPEQPKVADVSGKWIPQDPAARSIYYNEFRGGKFGAYSADGKTTLAVGTYTPTNDGANIKYFSQSQQKEVTATCVKSSDTQMTCTTNSGNVAQLVKA